MSKIIVVLVEDRDLTRAGIRAGLQQCESIEVIGEAANGLEGLKLLEVTQPDVAIIDIGLLDIDGIELAQRFKASQSQLEASQTKVMILTLQHQEDIVLAAFAAGADSYCTKEASFEQMIEALRLTHQGYSWVDPAIARIVLQHSRREQREAKKHKRYRKKRWKRCQMLLAMIWLAKFTKLSVLASRGLSKASNHHSA